MQVHRERGPGAAGKPKAPVKNDPMHLLVPSTPILSQPTRHRREHTSEARSYRRSRVEAGPTWTQEPPRCEQTEPVSSPANRCQRRSHRGPFRPGRHQARMTWRGGLRVSGPVRVGFHRRAPCFPGCDRSGAPLARDPVPAVNEPGTRGVPGRSTFRALQQALHPVHGATQCGRGGVGPPVHVPGRAANGPGRRWHALV